MCERIYYNIIVVGLTSLLVAAICENFHPIFAAIPTTALFFIVGYDIFVSMESE